MGYTHYMKTEKEIPQDRWDEEFLPAVKLILKTAQIGAWNIPLAGPSGEDNTSPVCAENRIMFNGVTADSYETMGIERMPKEFYFCKTNRKPYDCVCVAINLLAESLFDDYFSWSSDGQGEEGYDQEGKELLKDAIGCGELDRDSVAAAIKRCEQEVTQS